MIGFQKMGKLKLLLLQMKMETGRLAQRHQRRLRSPFWRRGILIRTGMWKYWEKNMLYIMPPSIKMGRRMWQG